METKEGKTALHMAAGYGHFSVIRRLVSRDLETLWMIDDNSTTALDLIVSRGILKEVEQFVQILEHHYGKDFEQQGTPLHTAAAHRHIEHDANPDVQSEDGRTPLSLALARGYPETAKILIKFGADPNKSKGFTSSPLCCVFQIPSRNLAEMVRSLVERGADLLRKGKDGVTALHLAVRENKQEVVAYIVDTMNNKEPKEKINDLYGAAFCEAVSASDINPNMAGFLLSQGFDVNKATSFGFNALHAACAKGTVDAVKWLLNANADINAKSSRYGTALCAAIEGTISIEDKVLLLLEHQGKPEIDLSNEDDPTPLQRAVSKGNASVVKLLMQHKADINITRPGCDTPLNEAIAHRSIPLEIIEMLLKSGADIHKPGVKGMLPIHIAANSDRAGVMKLLVLNGANVRAKDNNGLTPLVYGLLNNNVDVVKFLLSQKAYDSNPNDVDTAGRTPPIVATIVGGVSNLDQLLGGGFGTVKFLNAQDIYGKTALAYAAQMDRLEMVKMLIKGDANPCIADCRGYSPLYWAVRMSSQKTTEVIIDAMSTLQGDTTEHWNIAIHGALASGKLQALERLLDRYDVDAEHSTPDGWTPLYTASMYKSHGMEGILRGKLGIGHEEGLPSLNRPSCWHPEDKHPGINIDPKNSSVLTTEGNLRTCTGTNRYLNLTEINRPQNYGLARADFPMLPLLNNRVYYFEVTLHAVGKGFMAVGFCDDKASLNRMLGLDRGAWGFQSDNGNVYENGVMFWRGEEYGRPYREAGVTIGCGVNFDTNTSFYTRNGVVMGGWRVSAVFPGKDGTSDDFVFKGDHEGEATLAGYFKCN
ncbi:ankyrin repeat-containing domain protein [Xylaria grammica]|nr:ankyrin repeat-containing domain protein [Xylaria grammica]